VRWAAIVAGTSARRASACPMLVRNERFAAGNDGAPDHLLLRAPGDVLIAGNAGGLLQDGASQLPALSWSRASLSRPWPMPLQGCGPSPACAWLELPACHGSITRARARAAPHTLITSAQRAWLARSWPGAQFIQAQRRGTPLACARNRLSFGAAVTMVGCLRVVHSAIGKRGAIGQCHAGPVPLEQAAALAPHRS